jgi:predicted ATPase/DNA-binding SARP family transcriptional activator
VHLRAACASPAPAPDPQTYASSVPDAPTLRICLLGAVRAEREGVAIDIGSRRQRAILAALALTPGRIVSTAELIDALWGDDAPDGAAGTLQSYVSRLRGAVGTAVIAHEHAGYRLGVDAVTDVAEVEHLARGAHAVLASDPTRAASLLREALDRWQGEPLLELADDLWFVPEAARLRELHAALVDDRGAALVAAGDHAVAVAELERHATANPLRERTHLLLMRALHASGRAAEAMRVASRYREALADLGLDAGRALAEHEQLVLVPGPAEGTEPTTEPARRPLALTASVALPRAGRFVGRRAELADLAQLIRTERLVSVVGAGGMGKTRLVAELLASGDVGDLGEVVVAELSGGGVDDVVGTIAAALRIAGTGPLSTGTICDAVGADPLLLVLDNCEHVLDRARQVTEAVLHRCPGVTVVATSRVRLDLPDELVLSLPPLTPSTGCVDLFLERLGRADRAATDEVERALVVEICEAVGGLPLAVELAASRAASMGIAELHARLADLVHLLSPDGAVDRHRSLAALIDWSVDLLDPLERDTLAVLAAFESDFDRVGAGTVVEAALHRPMGDDLDRLVEASLVGAHGSPRRHRMVDTVRAYCTDRLRPDLREPALLAHARWVSNTVAGVNGLVGPDEHHAWQVVRDRRDDVRAALRWALDEDHVDVAVAIAASLAVPLHYRPDPELLARIIEVATAPGTGHEDPVAATAVLGAGARAGWLTGDLDLSIELAERAVELGEGAPPQTALHALGVVHLYRGDLDRSLAWFTRSHDTSGDDLAARLDALGGIGLVQCYRGDLDAAEVTAQLLRRQALVVSSTTYAAFAGYLAGEVALARGGDHVVTGIALLDEAVDTAVRADLSFITGIASVALASAVVRHRDTDEALALFPPLVQRWRRSATWTQLWTTMRVLAELLVRCGRHEVAAMLLAAADADPAASAVTGEDRSRLHHLRDSISDELGEATSRAVADLAASLPRAQVVERALRAVEILLDAG